MKIPQYTGNRELTTQSPNRLVDAASFAVKDTKGDIMTKAGETLSVIGEHFGKIMDLQQTTQAQTEAAKRLNDIHQKAVDNPDIWNAGKTAQDEILKVKSELAPKIMNQMEREKFESSFDVDAMSYTNKINAGLRTKQLESTSADALSFIDTKTQEYFNSSPADQMIIKEQIKSKYADMVKIGAWKADIAYKEYAKTEGDLRTGQIDSDSNIDPEGTLIELEKGKQGLYPDITQEERNAAIKDTKAKVEKARRSFERDTLISQRKNESQMLTNWLDGTLTRDQIKDQLGNGQIRRYFAEKMYNKLYDSETPVTDTSEYIKVKAMIYNNVPIEKINQEIIDGKINNADKKRLINQAYSETDQRQKEIIKYNSSALRIWVNRSLGVVPGKDLSADIVYEFYKRVDAENAQGNRIDDIAQELVKDKIKEYYPSTVLQKDVPNFIADRNSTKKLYDKDSKLKGKATPVRPIPVVGSGVAFDDL